ncbi:prolyl 4-hydroxylase subunit alpha-2-like isoform X3 [Macrobrachium rosenbergii]|uniref:prolyl 4-hydroxylase subunit alpha-2-like isoform X3 n=1 Tax=Macrobrachium rosenbergii TaxID=79674 RepID=UPI0034D70B6B
MFGYFVFLITFVKTASVVEALSAEDVSRAFVLDAVIVAHLKNLLKEASNGTHNQQPSNSDVHSHYVNKFIGEHEQLFGNAEALNTTERKGVEAASDPVKSLILTRRLSKDWSQLLRMSNTAPHHTSWRRVKSEVLKAEKDLAVLLEEEDLTSQTNAFVRIVQMYKLEPSELTELGHQRHRSFFSTNLKTVDVAFIGGTAFDERLYGTAVDLLSTVKQLAENSSETTEDMTTSKRSELLPHLNHLIHLASNLHDLRLTSESYKQQPGMFPRLLSQSDAESARLKCRLDSRGSPYLLLMPAMVEEHSLNPKIVTFYKVLSHKQINKITDTARPMLEQAQIKSSDDIGPDESFKVRSSYTAWVREERLPMLKKLRMKIEALTGMSADENTNAAEILQVNLYAAGGYYLPHLDAFSLLSEQQDNVDVPAEFYGGDRIGTFMFYMNDVEAGGHTAFPRIGVGVKPSAGSAVFWSNLLPDGFEDTRTMHGACPVLKGIKWVSNKWIRYDQQFRKKPCPPLQAS